MTQHFEPYPSTDPLERMFAEMERSGEIRRLSDGTALAVKRSKRVPKPIQTNPKKGTT